MKPGLRPYNTVFPIRQAGLSLVELMISLTIGLILLAGITTLIVNQSSTRDELEKSSRQIENGRYAIQLLRDDIEHAEFYGEYTPPATTAYSTPDPCVASNTGWTPATPAAPVGIYGYAGAAADPTISVTTPAGCLSNYKNNTAVLAIRRTSTDSIAAASAIAGTTYLQVSRCNSDTSPFVMATSGFSLRQKDCLTLATLRKYIVRIYYVSACNVCSGTGVDTVPTLKVVEFVDGALTTRPMVEGVEDMQFDYGVDITNDGAPDSYTRTPAAAQWDDVMAVRVNVLARNTQPTSGYTDAKSYSLSAVSGVAAVPAFGDGYKRHAYNQVVRLVNPSGRREQP